MKRKQALAKLCLQLRFAILITRFAKQGKHVLFVAFHAGLVERIYRQHITGNGAGFLEEVNQVANIISIQRIYFNHADRHAAIIMGQNGAFHGLAVYNAHVLVS